MLGSDKILVIDPRGMVEDIVPVDEAGMEIEKFVGIISPGFVNCHCHLELSHMKGLIPEGSGMVDFLLAVMAKRNFAEEIIYKAIEDGEAEMIKNGIVAVGDICNTDHTIPQKKKKNLYYHSFIEATGFIEAGAKPRFAATEKLYGEFKKIGNASIVPHAPYSVSSPLFELIDKFDKEALLTMHNQESAAENEFYFNGQGDFVKLFKSIGADISQFTGTGKTSLKSVLDKMSDSHKLILVHNVLTDEGDLKYAEKRMANIYWCFCPNANKYINGVLPDIELIKKYSANIVLGTDSLASNNELNIWSETKAIQQNFPSVELTDLLRWATINGAMALGIDDRFGSFEKGKRPGINIISETANPLQVRA